MLDPYSDKPIVSPRGAPVADHGGVLGRIAKSMGIDPSKIVDERSFKSVQFFVNRRLTHHRRSVYTKLALQAMAGIERMQSTGGVFISGAAERGNRFSVRIGDVTVEHKFSESADIHGVTAAVWLALHSNDEIKQLVSLHDANACVQIASLQPGSAGCHRLAAKATGADLKITTTGDRLTLPQLLMPLLNCGYVWNLDLLVLRKSIPIVVHEAALAKMLIDSERAVLITLEDLKELAP